MPLLVGAWLCLQARAPHSFRTQKFKTRTHPTPNPQPRTPNPQPSTPNPPPPACNCIPPKSRGTDFSRLREWALDGHAKLLRQTVVLCG